MKKIGLVFVFVLLCSYGKTALIDLQSEIERVMINAEGAAHIGVEVASLKNGQLIYQKDQSKYFVPGSSLKIFTAAAAFSILGVDYSFQTHVFSEHPPKEGVVAGNLYLKGTGDPSLTVNDLQDLIFQLKLKNVHTIDGDLVIDHSEFDNIQLGPGWMWDEGTSFSYSPIDALTINHSCVDVWVQPASIRTRAPHVTVFPQIKDIAVHNTAQTEGKKATLSVKRRWLTKENTLDVEGNIPLESPAKHFQVTVESPYLFTAEIFKDLLKKNGITLSGSIKEGICPVKSEILAEHASAPLSTLIKTMMKESDNLYGDSLFKKIGAKRFGVPGTWAKGAQAMKEFLEKEVKLDTSNLVVVDGSGLSRYNLISAHQAIQFLAWVPQQSAFAPEFMSSLPIAGIDGTLKNRMKDIKGKVRAKTGVMTGVTALIGYAYTKEGEPLIFSILTNGFVKPASVFRSQLEDELAAVLTD